MHKLMKTHLSGRAPFHALTWADVGEAHQTLTALAGSYFYTPDATQVDWDADLHRYRAAAVLHAAPGALCNLCWASSCVSCGVVISAGQGAGDALDGRMYCRECALA